MNFISLCSGIEAASVAFGPLGWKAAAFAEIEAFPSAVLAHHYPNVHNFGDMGRYREWPTTLFLVAGLIVGGPPCQAFSVAGKRESLSDERGNLTLTYANLIDHADDIRIAHGLPATICLYENVPGVLSTSDNAFGCFLAGLAGESAPLEPPGGKWANAGAVLGPRRTVAWRTLDAQYFGLAQRRRRVFVVASARNDFDPLSVLFEFDGVRRDSAPSREAGEAVTGGAGHGVAYGGNNTSGPIPVAAAAVNAHGGSGRMDFESETFVTHSLRGEGFDASEDGTGRGTPLVAVDFQNMALTPELAGTLETAQSRGNRGQGVLAFDTTQVTSAANRSNPAAGDPCHPLAAGAHAPAIAFHSNAQACQLPGEGRDTSISDPLTRSQYAAVAFGVTVHGTDPGVQKVASYDDLAQCMRARTPGNIDNSSTTVVHHALQVRRLTPEECEALQGFPRQYTAITYRNKPAADGPRYKALGNSWAVPVVRWIGQRIAAQLP